MENISICFFSTLFPRNEEDESDDEEKKQDVLKA